MTRVFMRVFAAATAHRGRGTARIAAGDFNGDGFADAAVSSSAGAEVTIAFGSPSGLHRLTIRTTSSPHALALADLDRDGRADLLVVTEERDELLIVSGY